MSVHVVRVVAAAVVVCGLVCAVHMALKSFDHIEITTNRPGGR